MSDSGSDITSGTSDSLAPNGGLSFVVTPDSWDAQSEVLVRGLDDFYDDYNTSYTIAVTVTSDDPLYQTSADGASYATM